MNIICKSEDNIVKIWGNGKILEKQFRLFKYLVLTEVENGTLLHNLVTGELIFLDSNETTKITSLPSDYSPWMDELIKKHFLVPIDYDDKKDIDSLRIIVRNNYYLRKKDITSFFVLPTTHCNARCFYCFEHGKSDFVYESMSDETADNFVDYADRVRNRQPIHIIWFGGEPLVGIKQIDRISSSLKNRGIEFTSEMVSNGYLFTKEIIQRAKSDWHLQKIQITLDGTEKVYNEVKNFKNPCESPFRKVLQNIDDLLINDISVLILLNIGMHNTEDLICLADELAKRFPNKAKLSIATNILYEDCGSIPKQYEESEYSFLSGKKAEIRNRLKQIENIPLSAKEMPYLRVFHCMADNNSCVAITPSGKITRCQHYTTSHFVGDITSSEINTDENKFYHSYKTFPRCESCNLYPSCLYIEACEGLKNCREWDIKEKEKYMQNTAKSCYEAFLHDNTENKAGADTKL